LRGFVTDHYLRSLQLSESKAETDVFEDVYVFCDAADVGGHELPATTEVAEQKVEWLASFLTTGDQGRNSTRRTRR
jgi:NADH dehydrogenase FAD-containing subunit